MKKWLLIGSIVGIVALIGTLAWSAVTYAQGPGGNFAFGRGGFMGGPQFGMRGGFMDGPGFDRGGFMGGPGFGRGGFGGSIDHEALLAEALGITVEELQAAQEQAHTKAVQQAVEQGLVTQEEADQMQSRLKLRAYLDRDALTAKALGITEEALEQARAEGKPMAVLIYELELDPATVRTNMQTAYEEALEQAVTDSVITREQADEILTGPGRGFGGPRGAGFHKFGGPGGFGGR